MIYTCMDTHSHVWVISDFYFISAESENSVQTWDPANIDKTWLTNTALLTDIYGH